MSGEVIMDNGKKVPLPHDLNLPTLRKVTMSGRGALLGGSVGAAVAGILNDILIGILVMYHVPISSLNEGRIEMIVYSLVSGLVAWLTANWLGYRTEETQVILKEVPHDIKH